MDESPPPNPPPRRRKECPPEPPPRGGSRLSSPPEPPLRLFSPPEPPPRLFSPPEPPPRLSSPPEPPPRLCSPPEPPPRRSRCESNTLSKLPPSPPPRKSLLSKATTPTTPAPAPAMPLQDQAEHLDAGTPSRVHVNDIQLEGTNCNEPPSTTRFHPPVNTTAMPLGDSVSTAVLTPAEATSGKSLERAPSDVDALSALHPPPAPSAQPSKTSRTDVCIVNRDSASATSLGAAQPASQLPVSGGCTDTRKSEFPPPSSTVFGASAAGSHERTEPSSACASSAKAPAPASTLDASDQCTQQLPTPQLKPEDINVTPIPTPKRSVLWRLLCCNLGSSGTALKQCD